MAERNFNPHPVVKLDENSAPPTVVIRAGDYFNPHPDLNWMKAQWYGSGTAIFRFQSTSSY
jgi:hypothetical protein